MDTPSNVLRKTTLSQIRSLQHVVILKDSATVEQVLRTLASHRLVSAPVVKDLPTGDSHHGPTWPMNEPPGAVAGFIDVKSIIKKFLEDVKEAGILEMRSMLRRMRALEQQGLLFSKKTIREHNLLTGDGSFLHVEQDSLSLLELASEAMLGTSRRTETSAELPNVVHRIAIFDSSARIVNIISQSDIVRYLLEHSDELGEYGKQTVGDLGFGRITIVSVAPELAAIEALKVMAEKKIGAVAVVNKDGRIIGNFSAADMRTITPEHFGSLALPVGNSLESNSSGDGSAERRLDRGKSVDFLEQRIPSGTTAEQAILQFARETPVRTRPSPGSDVGQNLIFCSMQNTLIDVMKMLNIGKVHRVFIIDDEDKPIGVITCTDILRKLADIYQ